MVEESFQRLCFELVEALDVYFQRSDSTVPLLRLLEVVSYSRKCLSEPVPIKEGLSAELVRDVLHKLRSCQHDPMWAYHAEIPKQWCKEAADLIEELATCSYSVSKEIND